MTDPREKLADALMPWVAANATVWPSQHAVHGELVKQLKGQNRTIRIAVRALWHLALNSRCWSSRQAALIALKAVAIAGEVDVVEGLPDDPELLPEERPDTTYAPCEDFMGMWSGAKPR